MSTIPFPTITFLTNEPSLGEAGVSTSSVQSVRLDELLIRALQSILDITRDIGGCENPDIIANWHGVARTQTGQVTQDSSIILFRDGGDWAEEEAGHYEGIGVLFCRRDTDQTTSPHSVVHRIHIPQTDWQDKLLAVCENLIGERVGTASLLEALLDYLSSIINDQTSWKPLTQVMGELALQKMGIDLPEHQWSWEVLPQTKDYPDPAGDEEEHS